MFLSVIPVFPLAAFIFLALLGTKISRKVASWVGVFGIVGSFLSALIILFSLQKNPGEIQDYREILWTWIPFYNSEVDTATVQMAFYVDWLSAVMLMVVTFVSSLIAVFAVSFMEEDSEISWFFACVNLFVTFMLILVLGDNLLVLFLGWEGVGLASYLLIGFWREEVQNGLAAMKAFITTRVGDVFLLMAIFLIFSAFGSLNIQEVLEMVGSQWPVGSLAATLTALCLLGGAVGKSAQLPLQIWLADAMRGPTPVSALIHAATMVTAGVYLIARMGGIFELSPIAQGAVLWIGAATLVIAGICALFQNDMKRVLAYSTMSQIGYMFLALGAGAYSAAMFHLTTHACFKALLFLSAGVVGHLMHHEYSLLKVGNLRFKFPFLFVTFLVGLASLSALPFVTAGFYSKELILSEVLHASNAGFYPWAIGAFGALLTGFYSTRLFWLLFFGKESSSCHSRESGNPALAEQSWIPGQARDDRDTFDWRMKFPLGVLTILSILAGFIPFPGAGLHFDIAVTVLTFLGIGLGAFWLYPLFKTDNVWMHNLGFEGLYGILILKPYMGLASFMRADPIRAVYRLMLMTVVSLYEMLVFLQTGRVLGYLVSLIVAVVVLLGIRVYL